MEKTRLNYDMSLIKFLNLYFGIKPSQAKNITHKDAFRLFSLDALTDEEFLSKYNEDEEDLMNDYIRVKDNHNIIMYYKKMKMIDKPDIIDSDEGEFNELSETEYYFILLQNVDINSLTTRELYELKGKLNSIKKYVGKQVNQKIATIDKRLRYMKRRKIK